MSTRNPNTQNRQSELDAAARRALEAFANAPRARRLPFSMAAVFLLALISIAAPCGHAQPADSTLDGSHQEAPLAPSAHAPSPPPSSGEYVDVVSEFSIGEIDGLSGNILFSATIDSADSAPRELILVLDLDGKRIRKVVDGPGNNSYPSWSPDGREFVFVSDRDGQKHLYIARWDGANQRRLTATDYPEDNPHWGPTGGKIVFSAELDPKKPGASVMSIGPLGGVPQQLTKFSDRQTVPKLAPDGRSVSYSTNRFWPGWDVCVLSLSHRNEKCVLSGAQTYCRQDYSPDGKLLAYSTGLLSDVDLGMLDLASSKQTSLTKMKGREYDATWSPDGTVLAFTAEDGRNEVYNLYSVEPADKKTHQLISSEHSIRFLSWTSAKTIDLEAERIREEQNF